jgi:hypothetical protein
MMGCSYVVVRKLILLEAFRPRSKQTARKLILLEAFRPLIETSSCWCPAYIRSLSIRNNLIRLLDHTECLVLLVEAPSLRKHTGAIYNTVIIREAAFPPRTIDLLSKQVRSGSPTPLRTTLKYSE